MSTTAARRPRALVVVESPAKAKTIQKILGDGFTVMASYGHVRDLPGGGADAPRHSKGKHVARLGVDIEGGFEPLYVMSAKQRKQVDLLRKALTNADVLYLATDGDREGEAIAWHLLEVLEPTVPVRRMVFHEITRKAILAALDDTREIDMALVDAQETRRIVDRLVGYSVSPLLWKKIGSGLSAGRVQSVALRLLVDRERERRAFRSSEWWDLAGSFGPTGGPGDGFAATLHAVGGVRVARSSDFDRETGTLLKAGPLLLDGEAAAALGDRLCRETFTVVSRDDTPFRKAPPAPFTTISLQQAAAGSLGGFTVKRTMDVAQRLYEKGHITYMRTDSTNLADEAIESIRSCVERTYGAEFVPSSPRLYRTKVANAQEAHEAIRPAGTAMPAPESLASELDDEERRLYDLIWRRTLACQMTDKRGVRSTVTIASTSRTGPAAEFRANGTTIEFDGFAKAFAGDSDDDGLDPAETSAVLPALLPGDMIECVSLEPSCHTTQARPHYTEASLVKTLESLGVGRPGTYAATLEKLKTKTYCLKRGSALVPTWTALAIEQLLARGLPHLVDDTFTARLEEQLDAIARGEIDRLGCLERFYFGEGTPGLEAMLAELLRSVDPRQASSVTLPSGIVVRIGKHGPYVEVSGTNYSLPSEDVLEPAFLTPESLADLVAANAPLGICPTTGKPVFRKSGPHGPYVQRGENADPEKQRQSLLEGQSPAEVDLAMALRLLDLPRSLGSHPSSGAAVVALSGPHGPYVRCGEETRSLPRGLSPLEVTLDEALGLLAQPKGGKRPTRKKTSVDSR